MVWTEIAAAIDIVLRETMLFASVGLLVGGIDDFAVDLLFFATRPFGRRGEAIPRFVADIPAKATPLRLIVFVPAWDESPVIGAMLHAALARFDHPDFAIYVGAYPNDRPTIDAIAAVAANDPRVRLVINDRPGPTTKGDCLNTMWRALLRDEAAGDRMAAAVILHDAEDMVHPDELTVFDHLLDRFATIQLPVLPLVDRGSRWVSGHYCDEFAEAHGKQLVVRAALGAGLPLAGVGCAIARHALDRLAAARAGDPFDPTSLTEDYELGLTVAGDGGRGALVRLRDRAGRPVAVRAYFPGKLEAAVRQKARWMTGIALAGWDRIGWSRWSDWRDHWMRMRDRRAPLAVLVLGAAYVALVTWGLALLVHGLTGIRLRPLPAGIATLLVVNAALMAWRLAMRMLFTTRAYGWREGLMAAPRAMVANLVALLAARRALTAYVRLLVGGELTWDKTAHRFPDEATELAR